MKFTTKILAAAVAAFVGVVALSSYDARPRLSAGLAKSMPNQAALGRVKMASLGKAGQLINKLVGPNASPEQYRKLANEVACMSAIQHDNLHLKSHACANVEWYGDSRPSWWPKNKDAVPEHLKGEYAGDFGFDPVGFGTIDLEKRVEEELIHGRWAMLAVPGILVPEILAKTGMNINPEWWNVGIKTIKGQPIDYLGNPGLIHASNVLAILFTQAVLMSTAEVWKGYWQTEPEFIDKPLAHPGFDPLGLAKDPKKFAELKVKEVKNGRLAMLAMLGFYAQAFNTGKTPLANLADRKSVV